MFEGCIWRIFVFFLKKKYKKYEENPQTTKRHYERPHPSCPSHRIRDTKARDESFRRSDEDDIESQNEIEYHFPCVHRSLDSNA